MMVGLGPTQQIASFPKSSGIYSIFCQTNKKFYIGSSTNVCYRLSEHEHHLMIGKHKNRSLQSTWNKYGSSCFTFEILEQCTSANVRTREQIWLDTIKESGIPTFNMHFAASGIEKGYKLSEKTRSKMSQSRRTSQKAIKQREDAGIGIKGRPLSEKCRRGISTGLQNSLKRVAYITRRQNRPGGYIAKDVQLKMTEASRKALAERKLFKQFLLETGRIAKKSK